MMELKIRDVAQMLNVSEKTVYRWVRDGRIPFYRINRGYRFKRVELEAWIRRTAGRHRHDRSTDRPMPDLGGESVVHRLSDLLERGGIYYKVEGETVREVFESSLKLISLTPAHDRERLLEALLERERLVTTAIGDGIALPHPCTPPGFEEADERLSLCFLDRPVEFRALDRKPVGALLFVFSSAPERHLETLSKLTYLCGTDEFRALVSRQASRCELLSALREAEERWPTAAPGFRIG